MGAVYVCEGVGVGIRVVICRNTDWFYKYVLNQVFLRASLRNQQCHWLDIYFTPIGLQPSELKQTWTTVNIFQGILADLETFQKFWHKHMLGRAVLIQQ